MHVEDSVGHNMQPAVGRPEEAASKGTMALRSNATQTSIAQHCPMLCLVVSPCSLLPDDPSLTALGITHGDLLYMAYDMERQVEPVYKPGPLDSNRPFGSRVTVCVVCWASLGMLGGCWKCVHSALLSQRVWGNLS